MITRPPVASKSLAFPSQTARCPLCGVLVERYEIRERSLHIADLFATTDLHVSFGCFICPDHPAGERWFTSLPSDLADRGQYSVPTRALLMSLVVKHKMSFHQATSFARTHLHLARLDATTVMRWMRAGAPTFEALIARQHEMVKRFSGEIALDEVYSNGIALLKATDPLTGEEIAYEFVDGPVDHAAIVAFLRRLKAMGFEPQIVATDGAAVYPAAIAEVWPNARHQTCVFHFMQNWTKLAMKALWHCLSLMAKPKKRGPGRPKKRGRPRKDSEKQANRDLVRKARFLFLKRPENLTEDEAERLRRAINAYSRFGEGSCLGKLRALVLAVYDLFGPDVRDADDARRRRDAILTDPRFDLPFLDRVLAPLRDENLFNKLIVSLDYENAERTTNHVERQNREYRKRQKSHYRLRTRRSEDALLGQMLLLPRRPPRSHPLGDQRLRLRQRPPIVVTTEVQRAI
jgi:hypothetical protein